MTTDHVATRTLVKSPPELWAECSDPAALARHIGEFGEITITRLDPEKAVSWEGEHASGTVQIEPSGWGTRVILTAQTKVEEPEQAVEVEEREPDEEEADATVEETVAEPDHALAADPDPVGGRFKRLIGRSRMWFRPRSAGPDWEPDPIPSLGPEPETEPVEQPEAVVFAPEPEIVEPPVAYEQPESGETLDPEAILAAALDSLGQAHHRPFSRA